jgi:hypothetical protein
VAEEPFVEPLSATEPLAKFLYFRKGHFRIDLLKPTWRAFMPRKETRDLSVFRTAGLSEAEIWELAALRVKSNPKARAVVCPRDVVASGLEVDPDDTPPRHANIVGWPAGKDARMSHAAELAAHGTLVLGPGSEP